MSRQEILLESGTNELEIIEFYIQEEGSDREPSYFGVNVAKVVEVIESPDLEASPAARHPSFLGTLAHRDRVLPVIDLGVWLSLKRQTIGHEVILVTQFNQRTTGFLVTGVTQIHRLSWQEVNPPGRYVSTLDSNCITGMARIEDHFVLLLDLEKVVSDLDPDFGAEASEIEGRPGEGRWALVVDDSGVMRHMVQENLERAGFSTVIRDNGEEAWKFLTGESPGRPGEPERVDILVSDIEMPRMDGYSLTKRIKEHQELRAMPVILFSSLITQELRHKGEAVGADDQISKPEFASLAERALALIGERKPKGVDLEIA
ncbi:MAG: chemotaxis signal transduction protein CheV [Deltaproteobacteria bacterium]|nr:chemotaxis signal transduction protein CheV [Deltaproteobacteria bacterium]